MLLLTDLKLGMACVRVVQWGQLSSTCVSMPWCLCGMTNVMRLESLCCSYKHAWKEVGGRSNCDVQAAENAS